MKIGVIIGSLGFGGAERVTVALSEYWIAHNHAVSVFTTMKKPEKEYVLPETVNRTECYRGNKLSTIRCLRKAVRNQRLDIILIMDTPMCVVAVPAITGLGIPCVVSERSAPSTKAIKKTTKALSHCLMRYAKGFVFQTNGAKAYYSRRVQARCAVIPNPLKTDMVPEPYTGERDKRIVAVGRLIAAKNYPMLFEAFKTFHQQYENYSLEVYGDGELKGSLASLIEELNAANYIRLMGARDTVLQDIRSAAAYVLSSDIEGMPNALIEAMAMGIPCISTDCPSGGPRDLITNETDGVLIPVNHKEELVKALIRIVDDKTFSDRLSRNAVLIRDRVAVDAIAQKWTVFFEKIVGRAVK